MSVPSLRTRPSHHRRSRGQSLVEFALVAPIILLLMALAIDFGRLFYAYVAVENAAKEGAVYGAQNPICATDANATLCPDPQNVQWRVLNEAANLPGLRASLIECRERVSGIAYGDLRSCKDGDMYVVDAAYSFRLVTPILNSVMGSGLTLRSESQAVVLNEAFDPTPGVAVTKFACVDAGTGCTPIQTPVLDPDDQPIYLEATAGETLRYRITVTNIGGQVLTATTITDTNGPLPVGCGALPNPMARNATWSCEYTATAPNPPSGQLFHLVTNTVTVDAAEIVEVPQAAIIKVLARPAEFSVTTFVSPYFYGNDGDGYPSFGNSSTATLYRPLAGNPSAWYYLIVRNTGGQVATGVTITDTAGPLPFGQTTATANCDAAPATIAPNATWVCKYQRSFASNGTFGNTVSARATNVTVDGNDDASASIDVLGNASCSGADRVVPLLVTRTAQAGSGMTKAQAQTAWTNAEFTGSFSAWSGQNTDPVWTQSLLAFSCKARTSSMAVTRVDTP
jgi:uncharacterized repeat protein (TIGR01451 family)